MTPELIASIAAVILSILASYLPRFAPWYGAQTDDNKRLVMLGLLALTTLGGFGLACANVADSFGVPVTCDQPGAIALIKAFISAVVSNQAAYLITPKKKESAA